MVITLSFFVVPEATQNYVGNYPPKGRKSIELETVVTSRTSIPSCQYQNGTVGFTIFPFIVALVQKKTYVECTKYVRRHTPATASSRQPQTTNKRTMAEASRFCYHDISFISWPNIMFETRKSIGSICSCHPLNLFCIGGLRLQCFYEGCLKLARS